MLISRQKNIEETYKSCNTDHMYIKNTFQVNKNSFTFTYLSTTNV